jgi:hypothetical protein
VDVVEDRPRRVARVRDVEGAAAELEREPRVDGAERELTPLGAFTRPATLSRIQASFVPEK